MSTAQAAGTSSAHADAETHEHATIFDHVAYWLTVIGVYFLVGVLFFYSGKSKLFDDNGKAPAGIKQQFSSTFVGHFPGVDFLWATLGVLEFGIFVLMVLSLLRGEFLMGRSKSILMVALALALVTFACLSFGQTSTGNNGGSASLYSYFGSTAIIFILVWMLPPNSPRNWLSSRWRTGG
jgi:hypothetical protein